MPANTKPQLLADEIQTFQNQLFPSIPKATLKLLMDELGGLISSGIAETAKSAGNKFPKFTLPNANQQARVLKDYLDAGPLVISFYRGAWCPYCNLEINALQQHLPEITAAGGQLIAISPQIPDKSVDQISRSKLTFDVLSDANNLLAKECGLVFTLPESLRPIYENWQIDIPEHNANTRFELPIPATYILDTDGIISYAHVDMDYTKRLEPDIIVEQLKLLSTNTVR